MTTFSAQIAGKVLGFAKPLHKRFRNQKIELFLSLIRADGGGGRLLDIGGGSGIDGEFLNLYKHFDEVAVVNLTPQPITAPTGVLLTTLVADGRNLPFDARSFDWVFSNAVIEHVGAWPQQQRFASEIRRVASHGYFVTTPNKFFPIEPHTMLPLYQFLPVPIQKKVAPFSPGYLRKYEEINLISRTQMKALFPEARILPIGFPVLGNSLIAYHLRSKSGSDQ
ncbi:MAG: Methyltransferase type 11 [Candidatus Acidoferrum typicum]|nr:Methyltransferase type 11 [Candidatus Acidoferrum typicum]